MNVHCHGSVVVTVLVQATEPAGSELGAGDVVELDGAQLVTIVVPGETGAGVGQILHHQICYYTGCSLVIELTIIQ